MFGTTGRNNKKGGGVGGGKERTTTTTGVGGGDKDKKKKKDGHHHQRREVIIIPLDQKSPKSSVTKRKIIQSPPPSPSSPDPPPSKKKSHNDANTMSSSPSLSSKGPNNNSKKSSSSSWSTLSEASKAFAPLLKVYGEGQGSKTNNNGRGNNNNSVGNGNNNGGSWKTIADEPRGAHKIRRSRSPLTVEEIKTADKFQEFRKKWEATNSSSSRGIKVEKVKRTSLKDLDILEMANDVGPRSDYDDDDVQIIDVAVKKAKTPPPPPVISKVGNKERVDKDKQQQDRAKITRDRTPEVHRIPSNPPSPSPLTLSPLPLMKLKLREENNDFKRIQNNQKSPSPRPFAPSSASSNNAWSSIPASWRIAEEQAILRQKRMLQKPGFSSSALEELSSSFDPQIFSNPMELHYPFPPSVQPQLEKHSKHAQRKAIESSFGWFIPTQALLNPILPVLPRLKKPDDLITVEEGISLKNDDKNKESESTTTTKVEVIDVRSSSSGLSTSNLTTGLSSSFDNSFSSIFPTKKLIECDISDDDDESDEEDDVWLT